MKGRKMKKHGSQKVSKHVVEDLSKAQRRIAEAANDFHSLTKIAAAVVRGDVCSVKALLEMVREIPKNQRPSIIMSRKIVEEVSREIAMAKKIKKNGRRVEVVAPNKDIYRLPIVSMSQHLDNKTRSAVIKGVKSCLDLEVSGSWFWSVNLTSDPEKVNMKTTTFKDWENQYVGSFKGYAKTGIEIQITVPKGWIFRVAGRGLEVIDGIFTLDVQKLYCDYEGIELFSARWVEPSRGKSVKVVSGFIAVTKSREMAFHGATAEAAERGLIRKIRISEDPNFVATRMKESIDRFCKRYEGCEFDVSVNDARESGSCDYGIRSWCGRVGLDYATGVAPADAVIAGYRKMPMPEVRRAILYAARMHAANSSLRLAA